jgi:hypothetical protein
MVAEVYAIMITMVWQGKKGRAPDGAQPSS